MFIHIYERMEAKIVDITKGKRTSARICEAAVKLFAAQGYAAVSMREIAAEVGIRPSAIYNHFVSKQDILHTILSEHMEALLDECPLHSNEIASKRLSVFVEFHLRFHNDKSREVFLSYMELRNLDAENYRIISDYRDQYEGVLLAILNQGVKNGEFAIVDPLIASKAIIGMLASLSSWYQEGGRLALEELIGIYWKLVGQMVGLRIDEEK